MYTACCVVYEAGRGAGMDGGVIQDHRWVCVSVRTWHKLCIVCCVSVLLRGENL